MKRIIKSAVQFGMEPPASEYGDMIAWQKARLRERYKPFVVTSAGLDMLKPFDTLKVEVDDNDGIGQEWYIHHNTAQGVYTLYQNDEFENITSLSKLFSKCKSYGKFDSIDDAMTWLFQNVDYAE